MDDETLIKAERPTAADLYDPPAVEAAAYGVPQRVQLLKVPVDILPPEELAACVYRLLAEGQGKNIVLLSLWDLLKARRNADYRAFVQKAALVIPISKSLVSGCRFLCGKTPYRYMPFDFAISLLSALEDRELTCFLLGSKARILRKCENNVRQTFPHLRIVGRYQGTIKKGGEPAILEAIRKAAPSLLLVGKGVRGEEMWLARNSARLSQGLRLWCSDLYYVFAERRRRPSRAAFDRGLEWMGYCLRNPLLFFRIFPYMYYKILLLVYKIFKK